MFKLIQFLDKSSFLRAANIQLFHTVGFRLAPKTMEKYVTNKISKGIMTNWFPVKNCSKIKNLGLKKVKKRKIKLRSVTLKLKIELQKILYKDAKKIGKY